MRNKTDEQLLKEANELDAAYAAAAYHDLVQENKYLKGVLANLVAQVEQDVPHNVATRHLWNAVDDALEVLGED